MSYGEVCDFLARHTQVVELSDASGARVAVCPAWQGRVMTSTCGGRQGPSFGFVHRKFIEAGQPDPRLNNYGGEDRMWLSPEGGPFSLWFKPGAKQTLENWYTPPALNEGAWPVEPSPTDGAAGVSPAGSSAAGVAAAEERRRDAGTTSCRMTTTMHLRNASDTAFHLDAVRTVRLLAGCEEMGVPVSILAGSGAQLVAYESENQIINRGPALARATGLVSIWMLGMLNAGPQTVAIVPYKPGPEWQLGPVVKSDYFGPLPAERLRIGPQAVLFAADSRYRAKIGTSQRRARSLLGSIDFRAGVLTLVQFSVPEEPARHLYMNNAWQLPQAEPYVGDVANSYNDGPNELGDQLGAFYEIESLSPAAELKTGQSLAHCHRTLHVQAGAATLARLAKAVLGVELEEVRRQMLGGRQT